MKRRRGFRTVLLFLGIICIAPLAAPAATVASDTNIELSFDPGDFLGDYSLTVFQDAAATDYTSIFFDFDGLTIEFTAGHIDEGSDWFRVQPGQVFSGSLIADNQFPSIHESPVPTGVFYLGVNTGQVLGSPLERDAYGWAALENTASGLILLGSAVAYDFTNLGSLENGLIVGTTTFVPEPGSTILLGLGLIGLARRNRSAPE